MSEEKLKEIYEDLKMKCFMIKKFELIPKIVFPLVIELCFIFIYVIQNIACRDLVSGQVQFYSWIFLIAYFIYHFFVLVDKLLKFYCVFTPNTVYICESSVFILFFLYFWIFSSLRISSLQKLKHKDYNFETDFYSIPYQ